MILYTNKKVMVHSLDSKAEFFNIVAGDSQTDTLVLYMFIINQENILQMSIDLKRK